MTRNAKTFERPRNPGFVDDFQQVLPPYNVDLLVVGGGGGAGGNITGTAYPAGGGGGNVALFSATPLYPGTTYTITIGQGGAAATGSGNPGQTGGTTMVTNYSNIVGGQGGQLTGKGGLSGSGLSAGGNKDGSGTASGGGGGHGGAGGNGGSPGANIGGNGGLAVTLTITGASVGYGGGGGGMGASGNGTNSGSIYGRGGGTGLAGNPGVVIFRIPTANYSGVTTGSPTVGVDGAFTVLTFAANGTYRA